VVFLYQDPIPDSVQIRATCLFAATAGAAGIGKTTFARKAYDTVAFDGLSDEFGKAFAACKDRDLRFRIGFGGSTVTDDEKRAPGTSLSIALRLTLLYQYLRSDEDFVTKGLSYGEFWDDIHERIMGVVVRLKDVLLYILKGGKKQLPTSLPIVIVNIDETNALLDDDDSDRLYLKNILKEFASILAGRVVFVSVHLTGTHAAELYEVIRSSCYGLVSISLKPLTMGDKILIIQDMASRCACEAALSSVVLHLLEMVGGVGRYLEILMMSMSVACSGTPRATAFSRKGFDLFLRGALDNAAMCSDVLSEAAKRVRHRYSTYLKYLPLERFRTYAEVIVMLSLLRRKVRRDHTLQRISNDYEPYAIGVLEKDGVVFLEPVEGSVDEFFVDIPFLVIHIVYSETHGGDSSVQNLLGSLHFTLTPNQNEQATLGMAVMRLKAAQLLNDKVMLSDVFPLRDDQDDIALQLPASPLFKWASAGEKVTQSSWASFVERNRIPQRPLGYINGPQAPFADSMVLCDPPLLIQDKQSVKARQQLLQGKSPGPVPKDGKPNSVSSERAKCNVKDAIFVYVSDHRARDETVANLGPRDVAVLGPSKAGDTSSLQDFFGPTLALRRLLCFQDDSAAPS
jgi:hypothetical protein